VYELARVGLARASIEFAVDDGGADGDVIHTAAAPVAMTGVAIILPPNAPAYATSVTARAAPRRPAAGAGDDQDDTDDGDDTDDADGGDDGGDGNEIPANRQIRADGGGNVRELVRREVARFNLHPSAGRHTPGPLARFRSAEELFVAARAMAGEQAAQLNAAFSDAYHAYSAVRRVETTPVSCPRRGCRKCSGSWTPAARRSSPSVAHAHRETPGSTSIGRITPGI
jgi:hypothetical protein